MLEFKEGFLWMCLFVWCCVDALAAEEVIGSVWTFAVIFVKYEKERRYNRSGMTMRISCQRVVCLYG